MHPFRQVDVFTDLPYQGNPVAVVLDAEGLSDEEMQRIANWTNLSETTFVLPPTTQDADYRVRIFTTSTELPFAGHPTLGTCHAWLSAGGAPARDGVIVQECAAGLIMIKNDKERLAFAAPPLVVSGPVDEAIVARAAAHLRLDRELITEAHWADNGPRWVAFLLPDAATVLSVRTPAELNVPVGLVGRYPPGGPADFEVRAFFPAKGSVFEDPVTGSLNAGVAQWLLGSGKATAPYVASQGTALGRSGRVYVSADDGGIWVGGGTITCVTGDLTQLSERPAALPARPPVPGVAETFAVPGAPRRVCLRVCAGATRMVARRATPS